MPQLLPVLFLHLWKRVPLFHWGRKFSFWWQHYMRRYYDRFLSNCVILCVQFSLRVPFSRLHISISTLVDINECQEEEICGPNASCINTEGSFQCFCNAGFRLKSGNSSFTGNKEQCEGRHFGIKLLINIHLTVTDLLHLTS